MRRSAVVRSRWIDGHSGVVFVGFPSHYCEGVRPGPGTAGAGDRQGAFTHAPVRGRSVNGYALIGMGGRTPGCGPAVQRPAQYSEWAGQRPG